jgi:hypothetical protein
VFEGKERVSALLEMISTLTVSVKSFEQNEKKRKRRTSQHNTVNCSSFFPSFPGSAKKIFGACPRCALDPVIPSMTAIGSDSCAGPTSTERAVMKHRKMEPLPTVEATSMRPA